MWMMALCNTALEWVNCDCAMSSDRTELYEINRAVVKVQRIKHCENAMLRNLGLESSAVQARIGVRGSTLAVTLLD